MQRERTPATSTRSMPRPTICPATIHCGTALRTRAQCQALQRSQARQPRRRINLRIQRQTLAVCRPYPRCRRLRPQPATQGKTQLTTAVMVARQQRPFGFHRSSGCRCARSSSRPPPRALKCRSPAAAQCANRLPLRARWCPRNADCGPLRAVVRTRPCGAFTFLPASSA